MEFVFIFGVSFLVILVIVVCAYISRGSEKDMANYLVTDTELTAIANKIREKTGSSDAIRFTSEFISEIEKLTDTRDANAVAGDIRTGKTAYVNKQKVTGSLGEKAAETYNTSSSDRTISANQILDGVQTIKAVITENIIARNIKAGVTVKVGDEGDDDRIAGVEGTFTSDGTAAAGDMLSGKTAYVNGSKVTGNIPSKAAATYNVSTSNQTITGGQYLSGNQVIRKVTTSNLSAGNIKAGVTVKVGDEGDDDRIAGIAGTFTSDATANEGCILSGYTAYANGSKLTGTMPSVSGPTITPKRNTQYLGYSGKYLSSQIVCSGINYTLPSNVTGAFSTTSTSGKNETKTIFIPVADFSIKVTVSIIARHTSSYASVDYEIGVDVPVSN